MGKAFSRFSGNCTNFSLQMFSKHVLVGVQKVQKEAFLEIVAICDKPGVGFFCP